MDRSGRYQDGAKRCSVCGIFMYTDETNCFCCNTRLRTKSRS